MWHGMWAKLGAKRQHFPVTDKPGVSVYLEYASILEYFNFCIPEIADRDKSVYANIFRKHA
jgi:hypothetical protein